MKIAMHPSAEIIVTPRLLLRRLVPTDVQLLYDHIFSDAAVMAPALSGKPMSFWQSKKFLDRSSSNSRNDRGLGVLVERATNELIGFAGLLQRAALDELDFELGFVLRGSAWGHGYATEIGRGQLHYGFHVLKLTRVLALISPKNYVSIAVLRKIGMDLHSSFYHSQRGDRLVYDAWRTSDTA